MSEINDILNLNEEVLWKRIKEKNLLLIYPAYIIMAFVTIFLILSLFYPGILALTQNMIFLGNFLIITGIVLEVFLIFSKIFIYRKAHNRYIKILEVPEEELKEYKIINALSNQRIIIKDIRDQRSMKKCVKKYSIPNIEFDKDYLFLSLKKIEAILFRKNYHQIGFLLDKTEIIPLIYFDFLFPRHERDLKMKEVMEILNKNFILEKYFENKYLIKYNFSLKESISQ